MLRRDSLRSPSVRHLCAACLVAACGASGPRANERGLDGGPLLPADAGPADDEPGPRLQATLALANTVHTASNGDLWPSCWGDDDALYAAWGDGYGFGAHSGKRPDIGVARITGLPTDPAGLTGVNLATDTAAAQRVFPVWSGYPYYQKPTGMLCVRGSIYLAVQDLNSFDYYDAAAATIARSDDHGTTWIVDPIAPMFDGHVFTTIFFLDYGKDAAENGSAYSYAYGVDGNWISAPKIDTTELFLARVPSVAVTDRTRWEFFKGLGANGAPSWSADIRQKAPVLTDTSRRRASATFSGYTVVSQGSVVYDAPLQVFVYTCSTEFTIEVYVAESPWGPFRHILSQDFGGPPFTAASQGGYAPTVPSRFISADGRSMFLQSNTWYWGVDVNAYSLRVMTLERVTAH